MAYYIAVFDWSLYTLPGGLPMSNIRGDTLANGTPSWLGRTFTYNNGASTQLEINDDDGNFQDGYVETGGAQTLAQAVTINGTTYAAGSTVENEFSMLDASGNEVWVVRIAGVNIGFTYPSGEDPSPGQTFTGTVARDGAPADSQDGVGSAEPYQAIVCFTPGALIETPAGPRRVETLVAGDLVATQDSGVKPIRWVSRRSVDFATDPEGAKPVLIKSGAFAPGLPSHDLVVSPQHRFVFQDRRGAGREVFVAAKALTRLPRVRVMTGKASVEYLHIAFERHEVVRANGVATESCYIGPALLAGIPPDGRPAFRAIFPGIDFDPGHGYGPTARPVIQVQDARRLLRSGDLVFGLAPERVGRERVLA